MSTVAVFGCGCDDCLAGCWACHPQGPVENQTEPERFFCAGVAFVMSAMARGAATLCPKHHAQLASVLAGAREAKALESKTACRAPGMVH